MKKAALGLAVAWVMLAAGGRAAYAAGEVSVSATVSQVFVNGAAFNFEAYLIGGSNYLRLRDLAYVLNSTDKRFGLGYDAAAAAITVTTGAAYTPAGGEMALGDGAVRTALPAASKVYLDGGEMSFPAYNIDGSSFFRLMDMAGALDIGVTYDATTGHIGMDTGAPYAGVVLGPVTETGGPPETPPTVPADTPAAPETAAAPAPDAVSSEMPDGFGVWLSDRFRYEGYFQNGKPNGQGTLYEAVPAPVVRQSDRAYAKEVIIVGQFVDGYAHGTVLDTWHMEDGSTHVWQVTLERGYVPAAVSLESIVVGDRATLDLTADELIGGVPPWAVTPNP